MADPAPPNKAGPGRWILLGCGILTGLLILGMGGCFGIFYFIYQGTEPVAAVGADYLRNAMQVHEVFGSSPSVNRHKTGWQIHTTNDRGDARISYDVRGNLGNGEAVVWLVKSAGTWTAVGARLRPSAGNPVEIGKPPREHHRIDWDD